ncbi:MAG: hypothetical protein WC380_00075 [Pedobacter sp.]|jgi:hypothetical protein
MTAKEYLKSKGLKNPTLDSGISGGGDAPRRYASDVMDEYANPKSGPIAKDGLIELGFVERRPNDFYYGGRIILSPFDDKPSVLHVLIHGEWHKVPNCTTIQDVKDLIRLFNIEK